ncbi:hypothetical protein N0V94_005330 [Neodidymelliopsis sp. IMI 364377]|nr:hypothetical protein N0V94_005330 [Neodidymelliopsis sp. IMI 364377]
MGGFKVIIVGGGLAGALLANGLSNNGVDFMVYERDQAGSKREGYQIRLGPGAQAGFRACLTNAHIDKITAKLGISSGAQATAPAIYNTRFQEIINLALVPSYTKSAAINRVVLRDLLLEPIETRQKIRYGKGFDRYEIATQKDGTEKVIVYFSDGSHDICDLLVGADGSYSKINKQLGLENLHLLDTHWAFLSKGNLSHKRMLELPHQLRDGPFAVLSKDVSMYYALYLPKAEGEHHQAANDKSILQYNEKEASFYWGLNIPVSMIPYKTHMEISNPRQVCLDAIKDWAPEFHRMLSVGEDDPEENDMLVTTLRASTEPKADWRTRVQSAGNDKGHPRVWLLGDAVHAMQPTRGQGGNTALADCADILPQLIHLDSLASMSSVHPTPEEFQTACNKYERAMMPRAFEWVKKSGGITFANINLDGFLGITIRLVAKLVMPFLMLYHKIFSPSSET